MRNEKSVIQVLKKFIDLVSEECRRNPDFAIQVEQLMSNNTKKETKIKKKKEIKPIVTLPDLYEEWNVRGEDEFRIWARNQPSQILLSLIREQGFDPQYKVAKWKDNQKIADFLLEKLKSRLSRGGAFLKDQQ
jgi:hypothetical protein